MNNIVYNALCCITYILAYIKNIVSCKVIVKNAMISEMETVVGDSFSKVLRQWMTDETRLLVNGHLLGLLTSAI